MPNYDFCIDRVSAAKHEKLHVRIKFGALDPGKEAARVIASQRFKLPGTQSASVTDYDEHRCPGPEVHEATVSASADELEHLGRSVASGDMQAAAVAAATIAVGVPVDIIKGAGTVLKKVEKAVRNFFKKPFG